MQTSPEFKRRTTPTLKPWVSLMNGATIPVPNKIVKVNEARTFEKVNGISNLDLEDLNEKLCWLIEAGIINAETIENIMSSPMTVAYQAIAIGDAIKCGIKRFIATTVVDVESNLGVKGILDNGYEIDFEVDVEYQSGKFEVSVGRWEQTEWHTINSPNLGKLWSKLLKAFVEDMGSAGRWHSMDVCMEIFGWGMVEVFSDDKFIKKHGFQKIENWIKKLEGNEDDFFKVLPKELTEPVEDDYGTKEIDKNELENMVAKLDSMFRAKKAIMTSRSMYEYMDDEKLFNIIEQTKTRSGDQLFVQKCAKIFMDCKKEVDWLNIDNNGEFGFGDGIFVGVNAKNEHINYFEYEFAGGIGDSESSNVDLYNLNEFNMLYNLVLANVIFTHLKLRFASC